MKKKMSFVIPCYNSAKTLEGVIAEIKDTMKQLNQYFLQILEVLSRE